MASGDMTFTHPDGTYIVNDWAAYDAWGAAYDNPDPDPNTPSDYNDWWGHGSQDAWYTEHLKTLGGTTGTTAPTAIYNNNPYTGLSESVYTANEDNTSILAQLAGDQTAQFNEYMASMEAANASITGNINTTSSNYLSQADSYMADYQKALTAATGNLNASISANDQTFSNSLTGTTDQYTSDLARLLASYDSSMSGLTGQYSGDMSGAYNDFESLTRQILGEYGTADQAIHTTQRGQAYAGLDSGFTSASNDLQAYMAQRGLSGSGVGLEAMKDLEQDRMRAGATAGVDAHNYAIALSDENRRYELGAEGNLYAAEIEALNNAYGAESGTARSLYDAGNMTSQNAYKADAEAAFSLVNSANNVANTEYASVSGENSELFNTSMANNQNEYNTLLNNLLTEYGRDVGLTSTGYATESALSAQSAQNAINNNQQIISNLSGLAQLTSTGLAAPAASYLSNAGTGFQNIAQLSGQTAIGLANSDNYYNNSMNSAQATADSAKGSTLGSMVGVGGSLLTGGATSLFGGATSGTSGLANTALF